MSKFYIESIIAHGSGKNDAVVSFGKGLNIIQGFSNTGKTCVVRCIDFIYGSSTKPFEKNTGYNKVSMRIMTPNGAVVFSRAIGRNQIQVVSDNPIESMANPELPVKLQISNGYVYYPESTGNINTYKIYPCKLEWIKITNCTSIKTLHIKKLEDSAPGVLNGALSNAWVPMNHIGEWKIKGRDLYDYVFYLSHGAKLNTEHLKNRLVESGVWEKDRPFTVDDAKKLLCDRFDGIDYEQAKDDVRPFVKDTAALNLWSADFFKQITDQLS